MYRLLFLPVLLLGILALSRQPDRLPVVDADTPVHEVLKALGEPQRADVTPRPVAGASAELGARLVLEGLRAKGGRQSPHFKCTSCHNVVREDLVLTAPDPEARLTYAVANDLPFLPGTTLWGAVNRESYYNGDYDKKYGDLVLDARHDLRGAIQLCAVECAQGEPLSEVEMESVVAYLHTLGLRLGDLPAEAPSVSAVNRAIEHGGGRELADQLRSHYSLASPATFVLPPEDRKAGYAVAEAADAPTGRALYERGCLHCHENQRYSFFNLDRRDDDYDYLAKHFPRYTRYSVYQVSRYGTSPIPGKRAYMPHYTAERMSDRQVESLRDFIEQGASK